MNLGRLGSNCKGTLEVGEVIPREQPHLPPLCAFQRLREVLLTTAVRISLVRPVYRSKSMLASCAIFVLATLRRSFFTAAVCARPCLDKSFSILATLSL